MRPVILFIVLSTLIPIFAQNNSTAGKRSVPRKSATELKKADPARERAMQLLEQAEVGSRSLDSLSRAFTLIQVARAYQSTDKKKELELLEDAIATAKVAAEEKRYFSYPARQLKKDALKVIISFDPARADALVDELDPEDREEILYALLSYYQTEKKIDRAIEAITATAQQGEAPYGFTSRLIESLSPEQHGEKLQLFTLSLSSFSEHPHQRATYGEGDFGEMVVKFHKEVPSAVVEQAVDTLLKDAEEIDKKNGETSPVQVSFASAGGVAQVGTAYQYRLFQLLPLLRTVAPDKAESVLKEQPEVQSLLQQYPEGLAALTVGGKSPSMRFATRAGVGGSGALADGGSVVEAHKAATILKDVDSHPQDVLDNALALGDPSIKTDTLINIAQATWKKNPSIAVQALKKATDSAEAMRPEQAVFALGRIVHLFLRMEDEANAKTVVERGVKFSDKIYKTDIDPDDPNRAPKIYWPSTAGWRAMLSAASRISPLWAAQLLKEVPDDECRTLAQLEIAATLLKIESKEVQIDNWKKHLSMSFTHN